MGFKQNIAKLNCHRDNMHWNPFYQVFARMSRELYNDITMTLS